MAGRSIATALELDIGGDTFGYTLHRVVGRKHVHLVVDEDARLQVRAPWRFSCESAAEVVIENLLWVRGALEQATRVCIKRAPLVSGTSLPMLDEELRLELRGAASSRGSLVSTRGKAPSADASGALCTNAGGGAETHQYSRATHTLGKLLVPGHHLLELAIDAFALGSLRLYSRPRALPPAASGSLGKILGVGGERIPGLCGTRRPTRVDAGKSGAVSSAEASCRVPARHAV